MTPFIIATDFGRYGLRTALGDAGLLAVILGLTAAFGWGIRYFGAKSR